MVETLEQLAPKGDEPITFEEVISIGEDLEKNAKVEVHVSRLGLENTSSRLDFGPFTPNLYSEHRIEEHYQHMHRVKS